MRLKIRVGLDQGLNHFRVLFCGGPHQGRLILNRLGRVDVRAVDEQHPDGVRTAGPGTRHERRFTRANRCIRIGAGLQEQFHERGACIGACLR